MPRLQFNIDYKLASISIEVRRVKTKRGTLLSPEYFTQAKIKSNHQESPHKASAFKSRVFRVLRLSKTSPSLAAEF